MERKKIDFDPNCPFCHRQNIFPHFQQFGVWNLESYRVAETDHFFVKPDVLPSNPDGRHFLVFPKKHVYNYAGLVEHTWEIGNLIYNLEQRFGPLVIFEHGGIRNGNNVQSVYHAHFHAIGGLEGIDIIDWMKYMLSGGLSSDEVYPFEEIPAADYAFLNNLSGVFNGCPYLYVEQGPRAIIVHDPEEKLQSQITQRSMHLFFSGEILDWKKIPENEEFARESVRRLANLIGLCEHGNYNAYGF